MLDARSRPDVFQAISDPSRRKLLELLRRQEKPVQELVEHFDMSFAAVSQHLRLLRQVGLVTRRRDGRKRLYRLNPTPLKEVYDWAAHYEHAWRGRIRRLRSYLEDER